MTELKPCPCGVKPIIKRDYSTFYNSEKFRIYCPNCLKCTKEYLTKEQAINNWNRRVNQ